MRARQSDSVGVAPCPAPVHGESRPDKRSVMEVMLFGAMDTLKESVSIA